MRESAYAYLEKELAQAPPTNEGWWPSYTAWQTFAVKVLAEGGRNQDSNITRLYGYRDRMPVFALAYLHDALGAKGESGERALDLRRRMTNAILPEGGSAHVEELSDPYLLWFWNSNVRSTAIVLNSLVRAGATEVAPRTMVRWLMTVRKNGRWGNTQENAYAMESLVAYYRKYESTVPDFSAVVTLGAGELARQEFKGRSSVSASKDVPMATVLAGGAPGASSPLAFTREGSGTLFYTARLRYAADRLFQRGLDSGFRIERFVRAVRGGGLQAGFDDLQGRRSRAGHADVQAHEGAEVRRRHGSASRRIRTGRVLVRDDRTIAWRQSGSAAGVERQLDELVAARRLRPRRAARRSDSAVRHPPERGRAYVRLRRARDDRRLVPHRAGARRGDVRARSLRPHRDGGDRDQEMTLTFPFGPSTVLRIKKILRALRSHPRASAAAFAIVGCTALLLWLRLGPIPADLLDDRTSASTLVVDRNGVPLTKRCLAKVRAASS